MDAFEREKLIQTIADQVLQQLQSASVPVTAASDPVLVDRRLITEQDVKELVASGKRELWIGEKTLLTPAAQDALRAQRVTVRRG
ncbi:hypothetical protein JW992_09860, partial [candidate division KSB1 bacterium]|nr:hypothetical protein [candidate division KSB1 bacterium]